MNAGMSVIVSPVTAKELPATLAALEIASLNEQLSVKIKSPKSRGKRK